MHTVLFQDDTSFMVTDATDKTYKMTNDLQTGSLDSGLVEDEFVTEQGWDDDEFEEFDFEGEEEEQY